MRSRKNQGQRRRRVRVAARFGAQRPQLCSGLFITLHIFLQIVIFHGWTMLGSNQSPLSCEGSAMVCWRFLQLAEFAQTAEFLHWHLSKHFRRFTRVAAQLLGAKPAQKPVQRVAQSRRRFLPDLRYAPSGLLACSIPLGALLSSFLSLAREVLLVVLIEQMFPRSSGIHHRSLGWLR